jgi:(E)-4-hydroxy-3-methylbut-2-enyl-diphosphate synthase
MLAKRKRTIEVDVGGIGFGGGNPVRIQSMTNTPTADVAATVEQIAELARAGSEIVRITVNDEPAAEAVPEIVARLAGMGISVPIVGDFHYNGHLLLAKYPDMARALAKYRINPGNVGKGSKHDENFDSIVRAAIEYGKPVRIGVNGGSLDQELLDRNMDDNAKLADPKSSRDVYIDTMVESAILSCARAVEVGLPENRLLISVKMSAIQDMVEAYERLAAKTDIPLHLGLTEAGSSLKWVTASSAALAILLQQGIGDTIRVSITPETGAPRSREVEVCQYLLQTMGLRSFMPLVTSCPGCGRTSSVAFQVLAEKINFHIRHNLPEWKIRYRGFESLSIAVMGCIVNGIGEAKHADIGIFLPGNQEKQIIPIMVKWQQIATTNIDEAYPSFVRILEDYLETNHRL